VRQDQPALLDVAFELGLHVIGEVLRAFARAWQLREPRQRAEQWQMAANFVSYTADKTNFYARGESWSLATPAPTTKPTRSVTVGRLKYQGNWDPEPQAFAQLSNYMLANGSAELKIQTVDGAAPIEKLTLLHVTGTTKFQFTDATRAALKDYIAKGGTIFFEAAGGGGDFAASAEEEISKLANLADLKPLPATSPLYGKDFKAEYRPFNITTITNPRGPNLRGIEQNGRVAVILSREDLSAGLVGVPTDGIVGYTPASARRLMAGVIEALSKPEPKDGGAKGK
jgi:hypothetical protein